MAKSNASEREVISRVVQAVPEPILCSPFSEPTGHWVYQESGPELAEGRRRAQYYFKTQRTGSKQQELFVDQQSDDLPLVNALREDVKAWREGGYAKASAVTKELLNHWRRESRPRKLFFCQIEAVETIIYLLEVAIPEAEQGTKYESHSVPSETILELLRGDRPAKFASFLASSDFPKLVDAPWDERLLPLRRLGCKMATGSGKTIVMAMLITWSFANRAFAKNGRERFASAVLVVAPNLTVKSRLQVLRPDDVGNYYDAFDLVPARYRESLNAGKVLVTNWHVFGLKSEHDEGGVSYRVVDKGEEDATAFTKDRLGELAQRLPCLVLNDEGHHCWRAKQGAEEAHSKRETDDYEATEEDAAEARVWLDGLDRINNCGLLGPGKRGILAAIDLSATPFYLGGSGYPEGSPFPWLVTDFGLVDAIESGIVKIPRLPVLETGTQGKTDEAGRPDPKYFHLWKHINASLTTGDRVRGRPKPEAVYRHAQGALTTLAAQWKERFDHYEQARSGNTLEVVPPAMIVVCGDTATADYFFERISGEKTVGEGKDAEISYGSSELLPDFANTTNELRTFRINSELLAKLQSDEAGSKDEKVAKARRIIDTIGKPGQPGEKVRCIVSVSMLTEGWDANNVTQILGVRAFGSQLLCEQVVGRGLRRRSYAFDEQTKKLAPEYVDVYGIPFSLIPFKGREKEAKEPKEVVRHHVRPMPGREHLEIRVPVVESYTYDLRADTIRLDPKRAKEYRVDDEPTTVLVEAVRGYKDASYEGPSEDAGLYVKQTREAYYASIHEQTIHFRIASKVMEDLIQGLDDEASKAARFTAANLLFPQVLRAVREFVDRYVQFGDDVNRKDLGFEKHTSRVVKMIRDAIIPAHVEESGALLPVISRFRRYVKSSDGEEHTTRPVVEVSRSQLNAVPYRSDPERQAAQILDESIHVHSFVANSEALGFEIPYDDGETRRSYFPDFVVRLHDHGGSSAPPRFRVVEIKGLKGVIHDPNLVPIKNAAAEKWCQAISNAKKFGEWKFEYVASGHLSTFGSELNSWCACGATTKPYRVHIPDDAAEKWTRCLPVVPLKVAAGAFSEDQGLFETLEEADEWAEVPEGVTPVSGMFIAQIVGRSMEPDIPDRSYALFRPIAAGSRQNRIVLARRDDIRDPETGGRYTVKKYRSEKVFEPDGSFRHTRIELLPLNPDYPVLQLSAADESELSIVAEFVRTL